MRYVREITSTIHMNILATSDLIYVKATSIQEDQSRGDGVKRGRNNQFPASLKTLSAQQAVLGTLLYLIKSAPTGTLRRNLFLETVDGNIKITEEMDTVIKELNQLLQLNPKESGEEEGLDELLNDMDTIE